MDVTELIIDLHKDNERQGPGDERETLRAIEVARLDPSAPLAVADLGAGTGASSLVIARALRATVTAIDAAPAFVEVLRRRAWDAGLGDSIRAQVGDMESPGFADASLDVIWCEAAIYNIGFEAGVRAWRRFLKPGGVLVVSDLVWTSAQRPEPIDAHWRREYPSIALPSERLRTLEACGYAPLGAFMLPPHCWSTCYYEPLRTGSRAFLERHANAAEAQEIVAVEEAEARLYEQFGAWYGYSFFIARRIEGA
ncbi:MAG: hypothetical protein RLZZ238_1836 [Planctomycetota bacterium]|jgi:SAM-dependent methyltransferase